MNFVHLIMVVLIVAAWGYVRLARRPYPLKKQRYQGVMMAIVVACWALQLFLNPIVLYEDSLGLYFPLLAWWICLAVYVVTKLWPALVWHLVPILALSAVFAGRALSPNYDWIVLSKSTEELVEPLLVGLLAGTAASVPTGLLYLLKARKDKGGVIDH